MLPYRIVAMAPRKRIALIAHDNCKTALLDWARFNRDTLGQHELCATGTTGGLLGQELGLEITRFLSGPLGGDQQVGAAIVEGRVEPQPHDVDVKALLRIAVVHNVPIACNRATADFLLSSPLMRTAFPEGDSAQRATQLFLVIVHRVPAATESSTIGRSCILDMGPPAAHRRLAEPRFHGERENGKRSPGRAQRRSPATCVRGDLEAAPRKHAAIVARSPSPNRSLGSLAAVGRPIPELHYRAQPMKGSPTGPGSTDAEATAARRDGGKPKR